MHLLLEIGLKAASCGQKLTFSQTAANQPYDLDT